MTEKTLQVDNEKLKNGLSKYTEKATLNWDTIVANTAHAQQQQPDDLTASLEWLNRHFDRHIDEFMREDWEMIGFIRQSLLTKRNCEWQPIETAPKDGEAFYALIDGLPYKCRYDEHGRFIRYEHSNIAEGASYIVHEINGKRLLEEVKKADYNYQVSGILWKLGFEHKATHWMLKPAAPAHKATHKDEVK